MTATGAFLLFAAAVVAATVFGTNEGLVSFYWGQWRLDMSLNLFVLLLLGSCVVLVALIQAVYLLTALPERAREWRTARRDRSAQAALREALAQYFGGRYSRAEAAACSTLGRWRAKKPSRGAVKVIANISFSASSSCTFTAPGARAFSASTTTGSSS